MIDLLSVQLLPWSLGVRPQIARDKRIAPQLRQYAPPLGEQSALLHELPAQTAALAPQLRQRQLRGRPAAHHEYRIVL
jgi:hypothetical protein